MKVLFITSWYPTKETPVRGIFVREHAKAVRLYDEVLVLHCVEGASPCGRLWRLEEETDAGLTEGIPTYRLHRRRSPIPKTSYLVHLWTVFRAFRQIAVQGFRPDIIHAHVYSAGLPAVLIARLHRLPVVITEQYSGFKRKLLGGMDLRLARLAFRWADVVLPVSKSLQQAIEACGMRARFQVVPNVVDTALFHPAAAPVLRNQEHRLLVVCLLDPSHNKGLPHLLHALAQLQRKRTDWHLDIVGDGPARAPYERLTEELGLLGRVTFHGYRCKKEVADFMRRADLLVLPSLIETFSAVAAEALATGTPVLATRCGGPEEFVTDSVGMTVPPGDVEALNDGLEKMLRHLNRFSPTVISRYAHERFGPEPVGARLHTLYAACAASRGKGQRGGIAIPRNLDRQLSA